MTELFLVFSLVLFLGTACYVLRYRPTDAARRALRDALERGDIRPEEYAAHLRALDQAA